MNARDRIALALWIRDFKAYSDGNEDAARSAWDSFYPAQKSEHLSKADAVLAVLPNLVTDPDIVWAASRACWPGGGGGAWALERMERALTAAAQAITDGAP